MRKAVAAGLRRMCASTTADEARQMFGEFEDKWANAQVPIGQSWCKNWLRITPFFDYPPEMGGVICTTNAVESVNMGLRKITKNHGSFPSDGAQMRLFYLVLRNISQKRGMPIRDWKAAPTRFAILFEGGGITFNSNPFYTKFVTVRQSPSFS